MNASLPYQYTPLQEPNSIRILCLSAGSSRILSAELVETTLGSNLAYEAISYAWGSSELSRPLSVQGGKILWITASLYKALRAIRHSITKCGTRYVWADGVCINQDDNDEKSRQVQLIPEIYRSACRVITYVGENTHNVSRGIDLANRLILAREERQQSRNAMTIAAAYARHRVPGKYEPAWESLRDFLSRSWYTRMWIVQESLLNSKMIMMCGSVMINWEVFTNLNAAMEQAEPMQYDTLQPNSEK
ncbi:hypothetical protein QQX98_006684 [Neonectria punicea]|uniref:Heterokaryon incompatibility domain-containing protein n=1 Tax=Neonectria punicea TaxID=979145 RepID=A0ABR1H0T9_9HYPO